MLVKTNGVNVPCSTSKTRLLYCLFFSFSCSWNICFGDSSRYESAFGWHTRTSKNADCCLSQNPWAWTSSRASGALFAPLFSSSPVISWRTGSVSTSVQILLVILTLDHNKYNDDTNHRQELFVLASHPFSFRGSAYCHTCDWDPVRMSKTGLTTMTRFVSMFSAKCYKKKQWKYILRPFREIWFAQVSPLDVTEFAPYWNWIKRLYKALDDGNLFLPWAILAKTHPIVLMTRA